MCPVDVAHNLVQLINVLVLEAAVNTGVDGGSQQFCDERIVFIATCPTLYKSSKRVSHADACLACSRVPCKLTRVSHAHACLACSPLPRMLTC